MKTAIQLRAPGDAGVAAELIHGQPDSLVAGTRGPIAIFGPGQVVAYLLRHGRKRRLFVIRTLDVDDRLAATVPGVQPRTQVLLEVASAGRIRRVRGLFAYLLKQGREPSALRDAFYLRVAARLGGRLPNHKILLSLLPA